MAARFEVELTRQAEKDLRRLRSLARKAADALLKLESDPYRGHRLAGVLRDCRALEFGGPGGQYRAVYVVRPAEQVCVVFLIGPHEGIYAEAERRYRSMSR